ncbi:MAG TPA: hypothetical protein VIP98_07520 [Microlunatus sp.]
MTGLLADGASGVVAASWATFPAGVGFLAVDTALPWGFSILARGSFF